MGTPRVPPADRHRLPQSTSISIGSVVLTGLPAYLPTKPKQGKEREVLQQYFLRTPSRPADSSPGPVIVAGSGRGSRNMQEHDSHSSGQVGNESLPDVLLGKNRPHRFDPTKKSPWVSLPCRAVETTNQGEMKMPDANNSVQTRPQHWRQWLVSAAILAMAAGIIVLIGGNWNAWAGDRTPQETDDAYLRPT